MRLFVALDLEPCVREALAAVSETSRRADPERSVRWTDVSRIHLTLAFLGEVGEDRIPVLEQALASALGPCRAPPLSLGTVGAFPSWARARVLWVGIVPAGPALAALHARVASGLGACGWPPDARPFQPHLTVGRVRDGVRLGPNLERALRATDFPQWSALAHPRVVLYRSTLGPGGSRYDALTTFALQL